jgi:predicted metal-dependent hydrolase
MLTPEYDPRYLAGIDLFNQGDYFAAHEVWEDLWLDSPAADRRFYQSLIQAAVALYHLGNKNHGGAKRLFARGRAKMDAYRPTAHGIDVDRFWQQVEAVLTDPTAAGRPRIPPLSPSDRS